MTIKGRPYQVKSLQSDGPCSIGVEDKVFHYENLTWDIENTVSTSDIPANTVVYFYIREDGSQIIDFSKTHVTDSASVAMSNSQDRDIQQRFNDFTLPPVYVGKKKGYYHRWFPWRCVGVTYVVENASNEKVFDYSLFTTVKYSTVEKYPYQIPFLQELNPTTSQKFGFKQDPYGVALEVRNRIVSVGGSNYAFAGFDLYFSAGAYQYSSPLIISHASGFVRVVVQPLVKDASNRHGIRVGYWYTVTDLPIDRVNVFGYLLITLTGFDYELRRLWNILS